MKNYQNITYTQVNPKEIDKSLLHQLAEIIRKRNIDRSFPLPVNSAEHIMKELLVQDLALFRNEYFIAQSDSGDILAYAYLFLNTGQDNLNRSTFNVYVLPEHRNKGIARNLLQYLCKKIPENITTLSIAIRHDDKNDVKDPGYSLSRYLTRNGGKFVLSERTSGSQIKKFDVTEVVNKAKQLHQKAKSLGYDIYLVIDAKYNEVPEVDYPKYVKMVERIWNDMPREDTTQENSVRTEEYHQEFYRDLQELGRSSWAYIAIHRESNKPIAMTETWLEDDIPNRTFQGDTGVLAEHRGNGLGLTLKYQMLARLLTNEKSKDVEHWTTGNADSNEHMLRINNILGYKEVNTIDVYEFDRRSFEEFFTLKTD
ncbi:MAG: GNAT family N-acetyltransferase [Candidatus Kariarchaeaceae archaeon]|jgi:GNAT superfamily N-acetyltransferase